jgi:hypothetical protein
MFRYYVKASNQEKSSLEVLVRANKVNLNVDPTLNPITTASDLNVASM